MKQKLFLVLSLFCTCVVAQTNIKNATQNFSYQNGIISITPYAENVYKLRFQPKGYSNNEYVTNAVVLHAVKAAIPLRRNGDTLKIGNAVLVGTHQTQEYRGFQFLLKDGEMIFGGGERALPLNRRGYKLSLYNNPWYGYSEGADVLNFSVPFFTSSEGYGLFFDNGSKGYADLGKTSAHILETGFVSGELSVFIILGKTYRDILLSYQKLTGTQPLPPKWAMGNFMSRFGYTSETQVKSIARQMKQEHIPFNAVIFDLFWFGDSIKGTLGNLDWVNTGKWPHPKEMINDFKQQNIQSILITEPFFLQHTKRFEASLPYLAKDSAGKPFMLQDFYFGVGGLLDVFRKDAGDWLWNTHYKKQIQNGVAGWWTDLGEPEKHPSAIWHNLKDEGVNRMMKADEIHNLYGHYWNKMLFEHYAKEYPNTRLFHLNRSGFSGSQRYSIFPWTGDVSRSWSGLRSQLENLLGMSMSGIPYIHSDAGGFAGGDGDNELYVRWLQFAAFTPIFRPHGTALYEVDKNAFSFPSEPALIDTPYRSIAKSIVELRYAMLPYNYTLAFRQARYGEPLIRPLYYNFPHDTIAPTVKDEFMWGDDILVAPVVEKNAKQRTVYFPKGRWYRFTRDTVYAGNGRTTLPVSLKTIPFWIKAGAIIPMFDFEDSLHEGLRNLSWNYYPSDQASEYVLFNDDGKSKKSLQENKFQLYKLHVTPSGKSYHFSFRVSGDTTYGEQRPYHWNLVIKATKTAPRSIVINGKEMQSGIYLLQRSKHFNELIIPLTFDKNALDVKVAFE
ncbi:MAG: glycoside hydrolase family 31 protein [Bacteroidota bacterium]|nr:glycoside hydrolase family 31 protein [Bacteroidota bacterium]